MGAAPTASGRRGSRFSFGSAGSPSPFQMDCFPATQNRRLKYADLKKDTDHSGSPPFSDPNGHSAFSHPSVLFSFPPLSLPTLSLLLSLSVRPAQVFIQLLRRDRWLCAPGVCSWVCLPLGGGGEGEGGGGGRLVFSPLSYTRLKWASQGKSGSVALFVCSCGWWELLRLNSFPKETHLNYMHPSHEFNFLNLEVKKMKISTARGHWVQSWRINNYSCE